MSAFDLNSSTRDNASLYVILIRLFSMMFVFCDLANIRIYKMLHNKNLRVYDIH